MQNLTDNHAAQVAFNNMMQSYPEYQQTQHLDVMRAEEYSRLDDQGHVYLDYTGGGLYAESQLRDHTQLLLDNVFGNPHSTNPTSLIATHLVERTRAYILSYFNASTEEYEVIFTPNTSGALKLVGESYPFNNGDQYLLTFDNHNSVNGIREFARARGAQTTYLPICLPDLRVGTEEFVEVLKIANPGGNNLFAYPAQSNFSGVQHPLEWIEKAQQNGWDVLVDVAAFVPTNRLDLSVVKPDYVPLSFYKMFGYPTGLGCLIAKKASLAKLHRPWFAGGTITVASVQGDKFYFADGAPAFEDGTLNYLSIPAIEIGLRHLMKMNINVIHDRVSCLTGWLLDKLLNLKHSNGEGLLRIYGPLDMEYRGGTVTMNFYDAEGRFFDHRLIEAQANEANISLRTGCFCNPGGGEIALGISSGELTSCFSQPNARITLDDFRLCIDGKSTGAVRVSVGAMSNFADVYSFLQFAHSFIDKQASSWVTL